MATMREDGIWAVRGTNSTVEGSAQTPETTMTTLSKYVLSMLTWIDSQLTDLQWAYERRREERDRDTDYGPEDYFDGALRPNREEYAEEDEVFETAVLIGLCIVVSLLLYVRGRMVERMRRDERERREGERREGDPAREEWAVPR